DSTQRSPRAPGEVWPPTPSHAPEAPAAPAARWGTRRRERSTGEGEVLVRQATSAATPGSPPRTRAAPARSARGRRAGAATSSARSEEHTSELQSLAYLVCRLLLEKKQVTGQSEGMVWQS